VQYRSRPAHSVAAWTELSAVTPCRLTAQAEPAPDAVRRPATCDGASWAKRHPPCRKRDKAVPYAPTHENSAHCPRRPMPRAASAVLPSAAFTITGNQLLSKGGPS
jgi:hypothetical protein